MHAFSEMHLVESPKSRLVAGSRLKTYMKGRYLFAVEKQESIKWMDDEVYALVLFMMMYTKGKS